MNWEGSGGRGLPGEPKSPHLRLWDYNSSDSHVPLPARAAVHVRSKLTVSAIAGPQHVTFQGGNNEDSSPQLCQAKEGHSGGKRQCCVGFASPVLLTWSQVM